MTTWGFSDGQMATLAVADDDCDRMVSLARACGVATWRIPADWAACEPSPTQRNWTSVDRQIQRLQTAGIIPLIVIGGTRPKYSQFSQFGFGTEVGPPEFAAFCTDVAIRYGTTGGPYGKVCTDFEIWSDPNNGGSWGDVVNAASYVTYLQPAYTAIKAVTGLSGTNSRVIFGGTQHVTTVDSSWLTQGEVDFVTAAYAAGAHNYFDVMSVHPFTDVDSLTAPTDSSPALVANDAIHSLMVTNGDGSKPAWWTFGYPTSDFTPTNQATYLSNMMSLAATRAYVQRLYVQSLRDTSSDPQNRNGNYGVIGVDWTLKPAYGYLQALNPYFRTGTVSGHGGFAGPGSELIIGGTLAGGGGFIGTAAAVINRAETLTGHGVFTGTAGVQYTVAGAVTGHGGFTGFESSSGRAGTLIGAGGFTATGKSTYTRSGTITGAGSFTASALVRRTAAGTISGTGHFNSTVTSRTSTSGTLAGHGALSGTGRGIMKPTIAASFATGGGFTSRSPATGTISSWTPQLNDVVVFVVNVPNVAATMTVPSGWVSVLGGNTVATSGTGDTLLVVYHQVTSAEVTAGTTAWTLTNLLDASQTGRRLSYVVRGANATTPIDVAAANTGNSNSLVVSSITPTKSLSLVTAAAGTAGISTSVTVTAPSSPWSSIIGTYATGGSTPTDMAMTCSNDTTAGASYSGTSLPINITTTWTAISVAFAPA